MKVRVGASWTTYSEVIPRTEFSFIIFNTIKHKFNKSGHSEITLITKAITLEVAITNTKYLCISCQRCGVYRQSGGREVPSNGIRRDCQQLQRMITRAPGWQIKNLEQIPAGEPLGAPEQASRLFIKCLDILSSILPGCDVLVAGVPDLQHLDGRPL